MTQARFAGRGGNSGRAGRGPGNGRGQGRGRETGYMSKPKTRTSSWAWDGVHVKAQNKDKVVGVGRGTRQSPRHLSCLLSRTYQTGCNGCDDCGGPGSNAVDWATQVSQIKQGSWPEDWLSKQGVSTRFIG